MGIGVRLSHLARPLFPACSVRNAPLDSAPLSYWRRRARQEALLAALITGLLSSAVQAAPQIFTRSPAQSLQELKTIWLPGFAENSKTSLRDCP